MPELLTAEMLRNICNPLQLLAMIISLVYPPVAAQLLMPVTITALFSNTGKTQATQPYIGKFQRHRVFLYHCSALATSLSYCTDWIYCLTTCSSSVHSMLTLPLILPPNITFSWLLISFNPIRAWKRVGGWLNPLESITKAKTGKYQELDSQL